MNKEASYIGAELREKREQKKITLEELARQTKINIRFLRYIEEGNFEFLPRIYTRSFVKLFAEMIGLDPEVYARRFDLHFKKKEIEKDKEPGPEKTISEPKSKANHFFKLPEKTEAKSKHWHLPGWVDKFQRSRILWFSSGALFLLILLLIILSSNSNNGNSTNVQKTPVEIPIEVAETQSQPQAELPVPPPPPLKLIIYANDMVWIKYAIDNSPPIEATFYSGDRSEELVAKEKITFRVGNSRAIAVKINDRMINQIDQNEKVANFEVTHNGIQKLNSMPAVLQPPVPLQTGLGNQRTPTRPDTSRN